MSNQINNIPPVDLVIVIDTSPSMKDEAQALSDAAFAAITAAKSSCASDLRVAWFGIEGTWKGTNFDQTIRAYLTQNCKISESKLRERKRGELKSVEAQEDAARAIEDVCNYFDWREGAARAIFYLGDEALEGGGGKTQQKDIESANLAIQKAKGVGVTVHTYFGTSKSRYRQSIATEYDRVATETGGQAFTEKDTIKGFSSVLEKVICGSRTAKTSKLKLGAVDSKDIAEETQLVTEIPFSIGILESPIVITNSEALSIPNAQESVNKESVKPELIEPSATNKKKRNEESVKPELTKPSATNKKKRLVVCCDGTWERLDSFYPTNVVKFAQSIKYTADDQTPQIVYYLSGLGTAEDDDLIYKLGGGAFGWGIQQIISDAYRFLCMNYDVDSQDEIYLVGFSRGAYAVRCLAGMIYNCGLLKRSKIREIPKAYHLYRDRNISPNHPKAQQFRKDNAKKIDTKEDYLQDRVPIKMLGCWDTVGALGIPDIIPWLPLSTIWNKKYEFFDAKLSPVIENAFHAVAIDEKRKVFPSTPMERNPRNRNQVVKEVLFIGEHGCVGGGTKEYQGLSDYSLQWMVNQAKKLELEFYSTENDSEELQIKVDYTTKFDNSVTGLYRLGGEELRPIRSSTVSIHRSLVERLKACPDYRPQNLEPMLKDLLITEE